jgi:hypothetical protein
MSILQVFTGSNQLEKAATFATFTKGLVMVLWPISYPISLVLDYLFGHHEMSAQVTRDELQGLMLLQVRY